MLRRLSGWDFGVKIFKGLRRGDFYEAFGLVEVPRNIRRFLEAERLLASWLPRAEPSLLVLGEDCEGKEREKRTGAYF